MEKTMIEAIKEAGELLIKQNNEIKVLINALERIRDWDDEMHSEWDDPGEFASFTLKNIN
jgi:predicted DNA-binding protein